MRDCGSCDNFIKVKNDKRGSGMCEFYDNSWTSTSNGKRCPDWTPIRYKRKRKHN